jgi:hypothetical protein
MEPQEFEKKMESLKKPDAAGVTLPTEIKLAVLSARRSATLGVWFVIIPYFFLVAMLLKYEMNIDLGFLNWVASLVQKIDNNRALWWIQPLVLFILPITGIAINLLSVTHFKWDAVSSTIIITLKLRWINMVVMLISGLIMLIFVSYLVAENLQESRHAMISFP